MARTTASRPRYVPPGGALIEVSNRTMQGRFLLRPSPQMNEIILGVMGRAQRLFDLRIFAFQFLSDHYHMLVWAVHAQQLAQFMEYFDGNLAREAGRVSDWRGKFWGRRYYSAVVNSDAQSQLERLRYILSNGCKEGLVASPLDWPGASSTLALIDGSMILRGKWFDRTSEYRARNAGRPQQFAEDEEVHLTALPSLAQLDRVEFKQTIQSVVTQIEHETLQMHRANGTKPAGRKWVMRQSPHRVPAVMKKSPAKKFLAVFRQSIAEMRRAYLEFISAYREASVRLRSGDRLVEFPPGCFPPRLPFVRAGP
jgi:REP element-mobilizing transposase RayT